MTNFNGYLARACTSDSECVSGYVCDQRASTCHDPCGTWFNVHPASCGDSRSISAFDSLISAHIESVQNNKVSSVQKNESASVQSSNGLATEFLDGSISVTNSNENFAYQKMWDDYLGHDTFIYYGMFQKDALAIKLFTKINKSSLFQKGELLPTEGTPPHECNQWGGGDYEGCYVSGKIMGVDSTATELNFILFLDDAVHVSIMSNDAVITGGAAASKLNQLLRQQIPGTSPVQINGTRATLFANDGSSGDSYISCDQSSQEVECEFFVNDQDGTPVNQRSTKSVQVIHPDGAICCSAIASPNSSNCVPTC